MVLMNFSPLPEASIDVQTIEALPLFHPLRQLLPLYAVQEWRPDQISKAYPELTVSA